MLCVAKPFTPSSGITREPHPAVGPVRPQDSKLAVLHCTSDHATRARFLRILNPATLTELVWSHRAPANVAAQEVAPLLSELVHLRALRTLGLFGSLFAIDARLLDELCRGLPALESLALGPLTCGRDDDASARCELAVRDDAAHFLLPLATLPNLRKLRLRRIRNIGVCRLPLLPCLTHYAADQSPPAVLRFRRRFPVSRSLF